MSLPGNPDASLHLGTTEGVNSAVCASESLHRLLSPEEGKAPHCLFAEVTPPWSFRPQLVSLPQISPTLFPSLTLLCLLQES